MHWQPAHWGSAARPCQCASMHFSGGSGRRQKSGADVAPCAQLLGVHITLRMRLECAIKRRGRTEADTTIEVLNEIVVDRGSNPYLTKIECWEHNSLITKVQLPWGGLRPWAEVLGFENCGRPGL